MAEDNNNRRQGAPRGAQKVTPPPRQVVKRGASATGRRPAAKRASALRYDSDNPWQTAKTAFARLLVSPAATMMTIAVLAIALALPGVLYVGLKNIHQVSTSWQGDPRIALYLELSVDDSQAAELSRYLQQREDLAEVELISRKDGLEQFRSLSGFGDVISYLGYNPIPAVINIEPQRMSDDELIELQQQLELDPLVAEASLDMIWVQRLNSALEVTQRLTVMLGLLLGLAVLLVIGNTVRVSIESRRDEIVVAKLVGATDGWVRRPFLYTGAWYGILGGVCGWGLIQAALMLLDTPVQKLSGLYQNAFVLLGPDLIETSILIGTSLLLGLIGAWVAVSRYLRSIEPR
ncbi:MAG: permease-like cell division protein FtsX [Marinobacterium sp.]|nr:permease-like cell division protein FtsX [Marinobacterium sp.]